MSDKRLEGTTRTAVSPRYIVMSLAATACIAAGVFGYLSDTPQYAELAGEYQGVLHANWLVFISAGMVIGVVNLLLALKKR